MTKRQKNYLKRERGSDNHKLKDLFEIEKKFSSSENQMKRRFAI